MKKIIILSMIVLGVSVTGYAQKVSQATPNAAPVFTSKDSALCKPWKFSSMEVFGVENPPEEKQKKDGITFTNDGNVFFVQDGKAKTGTWTLDRNRTYINIIFEEPKEQLKFKLMKVDNNRLKYEYQDPDLIRTIYNYEAIKK